MSHSSFLLIKRTVCFMAKNLMQTTYFFTTPADSFVVYESNPVEIAIAVVDSALLGLSSYSPTSHHSPCLLLVVRSEIDLLSVLSSGCIETALKIVIVLISVANTY